MKKTILAFSAMMLILTSALQALPFNKTNYQNFKHQTIYSEIYEDHRVVTPLFTLTERWVQGKKYMYGYCTQTKCEFFIDKEDLTLNILEKNGEDYCFKSDIVEIQTLDTGEKYIIYRFDRNTAFYLRDGKNNHCLEGGWLVFLD